MTVWVTMDSRGRITLPKGFRTLLGLSGRATLALSPLEDGTVIVRIKHRQLSSLGGILTRNSQVSVSIEDMSR